MIKVILTIFKITTKHTLSLPMPFHDKGEVLWHTSFFAVLWGIWIERDNRIFRQVERLDTSPWASITGPFCYYKLALAFILYAWRAVLFELANWRKAVFGVFGFVGYILKGALALVLYVIGDPITSMIRGIETAFYTIRSFYSGIVAYAPIPELTTIIILASTVLAISEASAPDSVSSQPYLLTISGLAGYTVVRGYISEPFFWTILLCVYGFSRFVKKRNDVTSALPVAAVFAAIGEPWVRILAMGSFLALAIAHHWKKLSQGKKEDEYEDEKGVYQRDVPLPLLGVALAIGIHAAAKWAGYRHLTWMIV
ncbi:uncharacterized protein LOC120092540 isoform X2 [Benincasa hispida]|uniref:uncharacterized protein LOC120092540 isoform X2 n=1 Tax=Benincasa hispida TaxID=102211 RepID=UPI001900F81B|nr:uncharacterized protein LOC120092540 isoform X2 [Benincasa hispida]